MAMTLAAAEESRPWIWEPVAEHSLVPGSEEGLSTESHDEDGYASYSEFEFHEGLFLGVFARHPDRVSLHMAYVFNLPDPRVDENGRRPYMPEIRISGPMVYIEPSAEFMKAGVGYAHGMRTMVGSIAVRPGVSWLYVHSDVRDYHRGDQYLGADMYVDMSILKMHFGIHHALDGDAEQGKLIGFGVGVGL